MANPFVGRAPPASATREAGPWLDSLPAKTRERLARRATVDLAERSKSGAVGVLVLAILVLLNTDYWWGHPWVVLGVMSGTLVATGLRLWAWRGLSRADAATGLGPYASMLTAGIYLTAATWSGFVIASVLLYPDQWPMWLVLFCSSGIAAGAASAFASDLRLSRAYLSILLIPVAVLTLSMFTVQWLTLAAIFATYLWFLLGLTRSHAEWYWQMMRDTLTISELNAKLEDEANLYKTAIERSAVPAALVTDEARLHYVNEALCLELGYTREELLAMPIHDLVPAVTPEVWPRSWEKLRQRRWIQYETDHRHKSGRLIRVLATSSLVRYKGREYNFAFATDITPLRRAEAERAQVQAQLLQSQKMEAIGRLAGGIAHDFNNLLTVILGYAARQLSVLPDDHALRGSAEKIERAAARAAEIVRQLLRISREEVVMPSPLRLNTIINDLEDLLGGLIGDDVELATNLDPALRPVMADRAQIEQVILNLVVNAAEAMPQGGTVTIATANTTGGDVGGASRSMVYLSVADTGAGMTDTVQAHLFEPFYTTKGQQGTGLGLAIVNGIVSQLGGRIAVKSAPKQGTLIELALPASTGDVDAVVLPPAHTAPLAQGTATVAVVDDDEAVLAFVHDYLEDAGYTVLSAPSLDLLRPLAARCERIDLLLTDVVMPDLSGPNLARQLSADWPGMRVLFMSGYAPEHLLGRGVATEHASFIQKPFSPEQLQQALNEVLHQDPA